MDVKVAMKRAELFHGLEEAHLAQLAAISQQKTYTTGDTVFDQDDPGDGLYIVGMGQVSVIPRGSDGDSGEPTVYLGEGQVFGEMALIDRATRSAAIVAEGDDTRLYYIPTAEFTSLCEENTAIGYIMMRNIAQDLSFKIRHRDKDSYGSA